MIQLARKGGRQNAFFRQERTSALEDSVISDTTVARKTEALG